MPQEATAFPVMVTGRQRPPRGIGWLLLPLPDPLAEIGLWVIYAAMVVTVVTGIDYVIRAIRLSRSHP